MVTNQPPPETSDPISLGTPPTAGKWVILPPCAKHSIRGVGQMTGEIGKGEPFSFLKKWRGKVLCYRTNICPKITKGDQKLSKQTG